MLVIQHNDFHKRAAATTTLHFLSPTESVPKTQPDTFFPSNRHLMSKKKRCLLYSENG